MRKIEIDRVIEAKTVKQKFIGLLGTTKPKSMYFQTRWGIHTFGMTYDIDVLILDNNFIVKTSKTRLEPSHFFFWNPIFKHVLELPYKTIQEKGIANGDKIIIEK